MNYTLLKQAILKKLAFNGIRGNTLGAFISKFKARGLNPNKFPGLKVAKPQLAGSLPKTSPLGVYKKPPTLQVKRSVGV